MFPSFLKVLASVIAVLFVSEVVTAVIPTATPFGAIGGISYVKNLAVPNAREAYQIRTNELLRNMQVSFGCENARARFEAGGGMPALIEAEKGMFLSAYDRSQIFWPCFYALALLSLAVAGWLGVRAEILESRGSSRRSLERAPLAPRMRSDAVDKLIFR